MPDAAFYLWARTPGDDAEFARRLYAEQAVTRAAGQLPRPRRARRQSRAAAASGSRWSPTLAECAEAIDRHRRARARAAEPPGPPGPPAARFVAAGGVLSRTAPRGAGARPRIRGHGDPRTSSARPPLAAPRSARASARPGSRSLLIVAINTGIAAILWIEDPRPFWHPFVTRPVLRPRDRLLRQRRVALGQDAPDLRGCCARGRGRDASSATCCVILVKGYSCCRATRCASSSRIAQVRSGRCSARSATACSSACSSCSSSARRARAAALHKAEAERHLLSKQAIEAELKLMQAQVEPHFLFNTLASVQYLTETDPPQATRLLGHLLAYLRAALPQLRSAQHDARAGDRARARPTSTSCRCAWARGSTFAIDVPDDAARASVPAEAADLAGRERGHARHRAAGRGRHASRSRRGATATRLVVTVTDTGRGLAGATPRRAGRRAHQRARAARRAVRRARAVLRSRPTTPRGARATHRDSDRAGTDARDRCRPR